MDSVAQTPTASASELFAKGQALAAEEKQAEAVEVLAQALSSQVTEFGELAPECADFYYTYGKTLLDFSIKQNTNVKGMFGEGVTQLDCKSDEVEQKGATPPEASPSPPPVAAAPMAAPVAGQINSPEEMEAVLTTVAERAVDNAADKLGYQPGEEDREAAWQALDTARVILVKTMSSATKTATQKEAMSKLAEVYSRLGDVSLENGNMEQAYDDFREACVLREKLLPPNAEDGTPSVDRALAGAHTHCALAAMSMEDGLGMETAGQHFTLASQILNEELRQLLVKAGHIEDDIDEDEEEDAETDEAAPTQAGDAGSAPEQASAGLGDDCEDDEEEAEEDDEDFDYYIPAETVAEFAAAKPDHPDLAAAQELIGLIGDLRDKVKECTAVDVLPTADEFAAMVAQATNPSAALAAPASAQGVVEEIGFGSVAALASTDAPVNNLGAFGRRQGGAGVKRGADEGGSAAAVQPPAKKYKSDEE